MNVFHPKMMSKLLQYYVRHFPIDWGKNRAISLLWKPLSRGQSESLETTLSQGNVKVNCDLQQLIQRQLYFWGSYEREYCQHWIRLARGVRTIFDVGANVGVYSLLAAEANPSAEIHAFEPSQAIANLLKRNIELNGFSNITANSLAVGSYSGEAVLRECRGSNGTNEGMNFIADTSLSKEASDRSVNMVSLDDYADTHQTKRIDLLKLDIEGGEYDALVGARRLLESQSIGCLFVELTEWAANRSGHSTAEITDLLYDCGYRIYRLQDSSFTETKLAHVRDGENVIASASASCVEFLSHGVPQGN